MFTNVGRYPGHVCIVERGVDFVQDEEGGGRVGVDGEEKSLSKLVNTPDVCSST